MPTVARENGIRFVIYPNDHLPPHVHVKLTDGRECRIDLRSGDFMDDAPPGTMNRIRESYFENVAAIVAAWEKYHPN